MSTPNSTPNATKKRKLEPHTHLPSPSFKPNPKSSELFKVLEECIKILEARAPADDMNLYRINDPLLEKLRSARGLAFALGSASSESVSQTQSEATQPQTESVSEDDVHIVYTLRKEWSVPAARVIRMKEDEKRSLSGVLQYAEKTARMGIVREEDKNPHLPLVDKLGRWNWRIPPDVAARATDIEKEALEEMGESRDRLAEYGIYVHPEKSDSFMDLKKWLAHIPGLAGTLWEGGVYTVSIEFSDLPGIFVPTISFIHPVLHSNVYPSGVVQNNRAYSYDLVVPHGGTRDRWARDTLNKRPLKEKMAKLLRTLQLELDSPCIDHPAQELGSKALRDSSSTYRRAIQIQADLWAPTEKDGLAGRRIDISENPWSLQRILEAAIV